jgi:hypothetical protein
MTAQERVGLEVMVPRGVEGWIAAIPDAVATTMLHRLYNAATSVAAAPG